MVAVETTSSRAAASISTGTLMALGKRSVAASAMACMAAAPQRKVGLPIIEFPSAWARSQAEYFDKALEIHDLYRRDALVGTTFAPHAPYTVSDASFERIKMLAARCPADSLPHRLLYEVERRRTSPHDGNRRRVEQREKASKPIPYRFAGLAVGAPFGTIMIARRVGECIHLGLADIGHRQLIAFLAARVAPYGVVSGVSFDAAVLAATA